MKKSNALNFEIVGVPIGDPIFRAKSIAEKRANATKFLALLKEVGSVDCSVVATSMRWFLSDGPYCQMHPSFRSTGRIALI